jgi:large subunit ribosomal protein L22
MLRTEANEVRASARFMRIAPRKVRKVANLIRNQKVTQAMEMLTFLPNRGAGVLKKLLVAAIASAQEKNLGDVDRLVINKIMVDQGPNNKRWRPRAMGRATRINKFTSHVHLFVSDGEK